MKEKKYIDRLYQEKFRDFEANPREAVWKNIEAKLQEKKEKKESKPVVPLWYRYAGIAAIIAFLFMIGDWILPVSIGAAVVNEETEEAAPPTITPGNTPVDFITTTGSNSIAETEADNEKMAVSSNTYLPGSSNKVIALNAQKEDQRTTKTASNLGLKNAIFGTYHPVPGSLPEKEKVAESPAKLKPSILEALKPSEETEIAANERRTNFEVSTHATPIYYGKMGTANPLVVGFNDHRTSEVTYAYGVTVAMNLSDKVKIRSGVSKVDLSYSASGIGYQTIAGVYNVRNASLVKIDGPDIQMVTGSINGRTRSSTNRAPAGTFTQGNLNQKMGYIEVPVEFEINLLAKKIELNLIGGGSTLFLDENEVELNTNRLTAYGEADNLNDVSFSANLGLGVDYNLSEKFKLNLEPILKYQIKTFDAPTGDVQPYFLGIYTGFSYKF